MEIKSRIIPAKPRNKELYFLKGTSGKVISNSGPNLGTTTPLYWRLINTDEFDQPLENPYILTNYPIVTKVAQPEPIIDPENPEAPIEPTSILNYLQIGDARLVYEDDVLKAIKENGDPLSFYATGELSAYKLSGNEDPEDPEDPDSTLFSIANATDVILTNTSTDDLLKYNGTKWVNVPMSSLVTGGTEYVLPTASATTLGGIKVGNGLTISSGVLSVIGGGGGDGTVTSVGLSVPTGLSVTGSPITSSGTLAISFAYGYSIPTTTKQANWDSAYNHSQSAHNYLPLTGGTLTGNLTAPTFIGALSGNASSATKLATSRTIWGQSFDGTGNVSGALSGATTIDASTSVSTPKINFGNNWTLEASGTELVFKYNGVTKQRFLSDGTILATAELTAYKTGI